MIEQLDMFPPATSPSSSIVGLTVRLAGRPVDPGHRRCGDIVTLGSSKAMHAATMTCRSCGQFRGWLPRDAVAFINDVRAKFGAPEIITIRNPLERRWRRRRGGYHLAPGADLK
jgi:hypothetical protein